MANPIHELGDLAAPSVTEPLAWPTRAVSSDASTGDGGYVCAAAPNAAASAAAMVRRASTRLDLPPSPGTKWLRASNLQTRKGRFAPRRCRPSLYGKKAIACPLSRGRRTTAPRHRPLA